MATYHRMGVFIAVTINVAIAAMIYYRIGQDHLFDLALTTSAGPFSSLIPILAGMVPVVLAIIEVGTALWAIAGGVQEERSVVRGPRR